MVFTYSNVLALAAQARADLRSRLEHLIGTAGVDAQKRRHRGNLHARIAVPADEPPRFVVDRSSTLSKHFSPGLVLLHSATGSATIKHTRPLKRASRQSWVHADKANTPESTMRLCFTSKREMLCPTVEYSTGCPVSMQYVRGIRRTGHRFSTQLASLDDVRSS
jgi:hypothetical protein